METRANYIAIGFFTLMVMVLGAGITLWIARFDTGNEKKQLTVLFPDAVTGLNTGANVLFNGIKIGVVDSLMLDANDPGRVIARLAVSENVPIKPDTKATLAFQGLTGVAFVELIGGTATKPNLFTIEENPVLHAEASAFQDILQAGQRILKQTDKVLGKLDAIIETNGPVIDQTLKNAEIFSAALANNADGIDQFLTGVSDAAGHVGSLAQRLEKASANLDPILEAIQPEKVRKTIDNIEAFSGELVTASKSFESIVGSAETTVKQFSSFTTGLNTTLESVQSLIAAVDSDTIRKTVENVNGFTTDLAQSGKDLSAFAARLSENGTKIDTILADAEKAAGNVKEFTGILADNKSNIELIIGDAKAIAKRLNTASLKINGVLDKVDGVVGGLNEQGLFSEIQQAAKSIRLVADSFAKRSDQISSGLARFSTRGLRDVESFISEARGTLRRIEGVAKKIDQDPNSLLFGGPKVKEYSGQRH